MGPLCVCVEGGLFTQHVNGACDGWGCQGRRKESWQRRRRPLFNWG